MSTQVIIMKYDILLIYPTIFLRINKNQYVTRK